jgi:hypothetical protein
MFLLMLITVFSAISIAQYSYFFAFLKVCHYYRRIGSFI